MWKWLLFFDMSVDKWPNIKGINKLKAFFANIPFEIGKTLLKILATKYLRRGRYCAFVYWNSYRKQRVQRVY